MRTTRIILLALLGLALLAGCSRNTIFTLDVDALLLLPAENLEGSLPINAHAYIPTAEGLFSRDLGIDGALLRELRHFEVQLALRVATDSTSGSEDVTVAFHLTSGNGNPFSAPATAQETVTLVAGGPVLIDTALIISETDNKALLDVLRKGDFRLGIELIRDGGAGNLHYTLETLEVKVSTRGGSLIGF